MTIDLDQADASLSLRAKVCVVGAGVAGILLATRLAERGVEVLLLEAGGFAEEDRSQRLYAAAMTSEHHAGTADGRARVFGGTSTRWGGQLLPYPDDVFAPPPGSASVPWPIAEAELAPFYDELQSILGVDKLPFDGGLLGALGRPEVAFSDDVRLRFSKWIPFAKRNFTHTLGQVALRHPRITVVTHANVAEILVEKGRAIAARLLDYARREFRCHAETFVVATGTIESSRLLLLSPTVPNAYDQTGRYFHDHISWPAAVFAGAERLAMLARLGPFVFDGTLHTCKLEASPALRQREQLPAVMAHVSIEEPEDSGVAAVRNLLTSLQRGRFGEALQRNLLPMLRGAGEVLRLVFAARFQQRRAVSQRAKVVLRIDLEQLPEASRRIQLAEERDALGLRKVEVHWNVDARETQAAVRYAEIVAAELDRLGMAPQPLRETPVFTDTFHAMGGLRMGDDARKSVVDRELRVHGVENLYVASCATFPSGGSSNPTFTLMCLALRLAGKLAGQPAGKA